MRVFSFSIAALCALVIVGGPAPALAQADFSGVWIPRYHEDYPERIPGPDLGDYQGLPINDAARQYAESWHPDRITLPEEQCRVHVSPYIYRGPVRLAIWQDRDPMTRELVAIRHRISTYDQDRTIYLDGRPHPSPNAPHTWMGFSTGTWEGEKLTVTTTHLKKGWHRRNGVPMSDEATLTEHFIRNGDVLTRISIVDDPVYLTEPLVKSEDYVLERTDIGTRQWMFNCKAVVEVDRPEGLVPMFQLGENPYLDDYRKRFNIPAIGIRGGAETLYPEFAEKLKTAK
jgi:hypothetical protein